MFKPRLILVATALAWASPVGAQLTSDNFGELVDAAIVQQTVPSDGAARLFHVPPLTENSARLWRASSDRTLLDTELVDAMSVQGTQDTPRWWRIVGVVLLVLFLVTLE